MSTDRVILHCDCNSFFASVETVLNPSYANVPMAVSGSAEDRHGIILAKNEAAKKYGIVTAETVHSAKKKCPSLVLAPPHYKEYSEFSDRVFSIYREYTDLVEPFGIDEGWLDVTASKRLFGDGMSIAQAIRKRVKSEVGITVSIGLSFNKVFAKLGSDYKKPDAITEINRDNFKDIVFPMPCGALLFVGRSTEEALRSMGIRTVGELAAVPKELLIKRFGKYGETLYLYSRGLDESPVSTGDVDEVKSVGNGRTFRHDLVSFEECRVGIDYLAEEVGARLREKGYKCATVSLSVKDPTLRVIQRQRPIYPPSDVGSIIANAAFSILKDEWSEGKPVRSITVTALNLVLSECSFEQIDMFGEDDEKSRKKSRKKEETIDIIRQKYGNDSILRGALISGDIGIEKTKK